MNWGGGEGGGEGHLIDEGSEEPGAGAGEEAGQRVDPPLVTQQQASSCTHSIPSLQMDLAFDDMYTR